MDTCSMYKEDDNCQSDFMQKRTNKIDLLTFYLSSIWRFNLIILDFGFEHRFLLFLTFVTIIFIFIWFKIYWKPTITKWEVTDVGFDHIPPGPYRDRKIARAQAAQKLGINIPPPYPNGWFAIVESDNLKVGGVVSVDALGQNLCVYRGEDGIARCVDTYCPHLGANLAVGGSVSGNCIECPFHKWQFDEDGTCVKVPDIENTPKGVTLKQWRTIEADGAIWLWHDAENRQPWWKISDASALNGMTFRGRNEFIIRSHIQDVSENGSDVAHLNEVHGTSLITTVAEKYPFLTKFIGYHIWTGKWSRSEPDHLATMCLTQDYKILNYKLCHTDVSITQNGPGCASLVFQSVAGPVLVVHSVTPLGPMLQRVVHRVFSPWYNAPVAAIILKSEAIQFLRDIEILNWKRFSPTPAYVRTDKTIRAFRMWHSQFYTENSISFKAAIQKTMD